MGFLDLFRRRDDLRGTEGGGFDAPLTDGGEEPILDEPGEGGPSLFMTDLAALRWATQQEAVNVGRMSLEPERWDGGRMAFAHERHLAHEHEALRDKLSDFVSASARDTTADLYEIAGEIADRRDDLREADRDLAVVLDAWNRSYREVHEDELELGRYFRLKSKPYQLGKWIIAILIFGAELAISVALFDEVVDQDVAAMPFLFAMGLILILMVIPHYSAVGLKEGIVRYHQAEMDTYESAELHPPERVRKKTRTEEVEDWGARLVAGIVGLVLVGLFIPLSSLRARELGSDGDESFWFWFFVLVQVAISGYFFLREWFDYGTASTNLKHHDLAKRDAEARRASAYRAHADSVAEFMAVAQDLLFLYRQAPRWDSHIVQSYLATLHHFRHLVTIQNPELDVFVANATVPYLATDPGHQLEQARDELDPVSREHQELGGGRQFSRGWWLEQVDIALGSDLDAGDVVDGEKAAARASMFENPQRLLAEFLRHYFDLTHPYERSEILDFVEEVDDEVSDEDIAAIKLRLAGNVPAESNP